MKKLAFFRRALCFSLALLVLAATVSCKKDEEEVEELEENQLAVTWHMGKINAPVGIRTAGLTEGTEGYSYTDVITLPKKGTKVTFIDDNTVNENDTAFATKDTYVISHWVEVNGEWVLDDPGDHYPGYGGNRYEEIASNIENGKRVEYAYVTSFDNENIRICVKSGQTSESEKKVNVPKVYAERLKGDAANSGTLLTTTTYAYKDYILYKYAATTEKTWSVFEGKTMYLMGDSSFDAERPKVEPFDPYIWPNFIAQKYGMALSNWGKSGSSVSAFTYTSDGKTKNGNNPMCARIDQMTAGEPDIVVFRGGGNDYNIGAPLGSIYEDEEHTVLSYDTQTYYGALNESFRQLRERYPNAFLVAVTGWSGALSSKSVTETDGVARQYTKLTYSNALLTFCEETGVAVINAMEAPVDITDAAFAARYARSGKTNDGHLNIDGMVMVTPFFEEELGTLYAAYLEGNGE